MPRADKAAALVAGAETPAAVGPLLADGVRVRVLRQFFASHEIHEVGKVFEVTPSLARILISAGKAEVAVDEPLEAETL
jgi:hypothetical protein